MIIKKEFYKKIIIILIIVNFILLLSISAVLILNTIRKKDFNTIIAKADLSLSRNAYDTSESLLRSVLPFANSKEDYLRIIKRAEIIRTKSRNNNLFHDATEKAYEKFKRDSSIITLYIFALINDEEYTKASEIYNDRGKAVIPETFVITLYSYLFKNNQDITLLENIENKTITAILAGDKNNANYEYLYSISENPLILNNYLLSLLLSGNFDKVATLLNSDKEAANINQELVALIYYDNKEYSDASAILSALWERNFNLPRVGEKNKNEDTGLLLLLADTFMYLKKYEKAKIAYQTVLKKYPQFSWIPYVNLDWLQQFIPLEHNYTADALELFPTDKELLFLSILKDKENHDLYTENQDQYISRFWDYYNQGNMSRQLKIFFAKELYRMGRNEELDIFLSKIENRDTGWSLFFQSMLNASIKNYNDAITGFRNYYNEYRSAEALYNSAIISIINKDYETAVSYLSQVLKIIESSENNNITFLNMTEEGEVYLMLSLSNFLLKNYNEGMIFLETAIKKGNRSIEARYLESYYKSQMGD